MFVVKRNGKREEVKFDKILQRVKALADGDLKIEPVSVSQKVVAGLHDGITSAKIDDLLAETAAVLTTEHPDYSYLAARIAVSSLHKSTGDFYQTMKALYKHGILADDFIENVKKHAKKLESLIDYERDFNFDYFGFKTLERSYLLKIDGKIVERPQHMYMRCAIGICGDDLTAVKELYNLLSQGYYTHATPTLFNAGTKRPQMSSCFLVAMQDDSIEGIFGTLGDVAQISKNAGGIGMHIHNIRAQGSYIKGTNGVSNGIVPMLQVYNATMRYVDQGGGKRKGSCAIYMEPWHADIISFLDLKKNTGKEEFRARDLFPAMWIPDLFMQRVKDDAMWTLMCPHECPGLSDAVGEDFVKLYTKYETDGKGREQMKARDLMVKIIESQIETGTPYMLYKDACNLKSNQKNLGTIKSSNLCTEIIEWSGPDETAVCNLASLALSKFIKDGKFDHDALAKVVMIALYNLNKVIDRNFYPTDRTRRSNMRHRPVGLGVQGLADVFFMLGLAFDSDEAKKLNRDIYETIYYAAVKASVELAKKEGAYETFKGSPASQGILQFDMWDVKPSDRYDWKALKADVVKHGLRNSLLLAPMPTASTASILGNFEANEAQTSNIQKRQVLAGEFIVLNKYLVGELEKIQMWTDEVKDKIIADGGSVQNIPEIPQKLKDIYKTVWELSQKSVIDMAADRGAFICQSQSMNLFMAKPNIGAINSMHFYAWSKGLKTGMYYLRTKPSVEAQKVTTKQEARVVPAAAPAPVSVAQEVAATAVSKAEEKAAAIMCSLDNPESCESCGS